MALNGNLTGSAQYFNDVDFYAGIATTSLRFDDGSSPSLSKTPDASNRKTHTLSMWIKRCELGANNSLFRANGSGDTGHIDIWFDANDKLEVAGASTYFRITNRRFRDVGSWYHIVFAFDTTDSTANNRLKIYVNGVQETSFATNNAIGEDADTGINANIVHSIGTGYAHFDGYMAEINFIDGTQLTPTSFGETKNGVWIAKDTSGLTFGTEGYRLQMKQSGVGTASTSTIGADTSGNDNHYTSSGIVASDCAMPDSPENNFCTLNFNRTGQTSNLKNGALTYKDGNTGGPRSSVGTFGATSGKWYFEIRLDNDLYSTMSGFMDVSQYTGSHLATDTARGTGYLGWDERGYLYPDQTGSVLSGHDYTTNDVVSFAIDVDAGKAFIRKNADAFLASADPSDGSNPNHTFTAGQPMTPFIGSYRNAEYTLNCGQDSTFRGQETATTHTDSNGFGQFHTEPPSGYLALCTANLPEPTIGPNSDTQSTDHFNTVLYTSDNIGAGGTQNVTGVGFKPDWVWLKNRTSASTSHTLYDSNRGTGKHNSPDANVGEVGANSEYGYLGTFGNDGYTLRGGSTNANYVNQSTDAYVSWNWKANGGTTSTLTDGDIDTVVQANTTAGFSIMTFVSNQQQAQELAHGLGAVPAWFILKSRDEDNAFYHYHKGISETKTIFWGSGSLGTGAAETSSGAWDNTVPTSTVVTAGIGGMSFDNTHNIVGYAFAEVDGFSKFDKYTGNNNADGPFVYLGFTPALIITKNFSSAGGSWGMYDNKRNSTNDAGTFMLRANKNEADYFHATYTPIDFLSNGFKIRNTGGEDNSAQSFMYMAFAEAPFKYANAR